MSRWAPVLCAAVPGAQVPVLLDAPGYLGVSLQLSVLVTVVTAVEDDVLAVPFSVWN